MIYLGLYVAPLLLYMIKQKNYTVNTKNPNFFPPFPFARKHQTFVLLRFYI